MKVVSEEVAFALALLALGVAVGGAVFCLPGWKIPGRMTVATAGAFFLVVLGGEVAWHMTDRMRATQDGDKDGNGEEDGDGRAPGSQRAQLVGYAEGSFFAIWVAVAGTGVLPWMVAWLGLKLGANWGKGNGAAEGERKKLRINRMAALTGSLVSLTFATLAGLLVGALWPHADLHAAGDGLLSLLPVAPFL